MLKLYIEGMVNGVINIDSLSEIAPGLEGYFKEWWEHTTKAVGAGKPPG